MLRRESGFYNVREKTNHNDHPRIAQLYNNRKWLKPTSPYCGTSAAWAIKEAGYQLDVEYPPIARNWTLKKKYIIWSRTAGPVGGIPKRNDVVVFYQGGYWHVGLLEDWQEGSVYCKTVEGNTSDRGVSGVKKASGREGVYCDKLRNKKDVYCVVRPYL